MASERKKVIRICGDLAGHFAPKKRALLGTAGPELPAGEPGLASLELCVDSATDASDMEKEQHAA